jgi:hypothetical protein
MPAETLAEHSVSPCLKQLQLLAQLSPTDQTQLVVEKQDSQSVYLDCVAGKAKLSPLLQPTAADAAG